MTDLPKRDRVRHSKPWTWPLIVLGILLVLVIGGTIGALLL
jgi:hypothetical protein